jgi:hypothetical protein
MLAVVALVRFVTFAASQVPPAPAPVIGPARRGF